MVRAAIVGSLGAGDNTLRGLGGGGGNIDEERGEEGVAGHGGGATIAIAEEFNAPRNAVRDKEVSTVFVSSGAVVVVVQKVVSSSEEGRG